MNRADKMTVRLFLKRREDGDTVRTDKNARRKMWNEGGVKFCSLSFLR